MITLAELATQYRQALEDEFADQLKPAHRFALRALTQCRTPACGSVLYACNPCEKTLVCTHSCGHRSCPQCQHQSNQLWLERQQQKLLPVDYFMVTFTLPYELRHWVWLHQRPAYAALFEAATATLNTFAKNDRQLQGELGMTAVLHTHSRRLAFHPHLHVIVPAGALNKNQAQWQSKSGHYWFNGLALSSVFKAKFLQGLNQKSTPCPDSLPKKWVVQCQAVGRGLPALKYLARYLYRGVINESNIISHKKGEVSFRYKDSKTNDWKVRTESAVHFLWLVLQHVLPKGFRRARDYGFLHCRAKRTLQRIQLLLKVTLPPPGSVLKKAIICPSCKNPMRFMSSYYPLQTKQRPT